MNGLGGSDRGAGEQEKGGRRKEREAEMVGRFGWRCWSFSGACGRARAKPLDLTYVHYALPGKQKKKGGKKKRGVVWRFLWVVLS